MAQKYDLTQRNGHPIEKGASFDLSVTYWEDEGKTTKVNLTGYTARMWVKAYHDAPAAVLQIASGAGITLGGVNGTVVVHLTPVQTTNLEVLQDGVWDLKLIAADGNVERFLEGRVDITPEVTT